VCPRPPRARGGRRSAEETGVQEIEPGPTEGRGSDAERALHIAGVPPVECDRWQDGDGGEGNGRDLHRSRMLWKHADRAAGLVGGTRPMRGTSVTGMTGMRGGDGDGRPGGTQVGAGDEAGDRNDDRCRHEPLHDALISHSRGQSTCKRRALVAPSGSVDAFVAWTAGRTPGFLVRRNGLRTCVGRGQVPPGGRHSGIVSTSASHAATEASDGMRQSPRGESEPPEPTLGESGTQSRLNWFAKNRRRKTPSQRLIVARS
jgi:hypothetical protein